VWRVRPALAPNASAVASKEPWSTQKNPEVAARMAREGSCTVPQMQDVLIKELSVRKSAMPKWKAQCVEKIFELAKLSTQQATLPVVVAAAAAPTPPTTAAAIVATTAAATAAVQAEDQADEALAAHIEEQRTAAAGEELQDGDMPDVARGDEPIELEVPEVESHAADGEADGEASDDEDGAADGAAAASEAASTAVIAALQQLCEEAESDPDAAADAVLAAPSIWRCCSSEARTPAWKCGGCNLWTHNSCKRKPGRWCAQDGANPQCAVCLKAAAAAGSGVGVRSRRAQSITI
jgi:hypothetical protein